MKYCNISVENFLHFRRNYFRENIELENYIYKLIKFILKNLPTNQYSIEIKKQINRNFFFLSDDRKYRNNAIFVKLH